MVSVISIVNEVFGICVEGIKAEVELQNAGSFLLALHILWIDWRTERVKTLIILLVMVSGIGG